MNTVSHLRSVSERAASGRVHDQQRLSDLIGAVYDAAIDPSALGERHRENSPTLSAAAGAALFCKDVGVYHAASSTASDIGSRYPSRSFDRSIRLHRALSRRPRSADCDHRPDSLRDFTRTELYRQWAEPQGLVDFLSAVVDRTAISTAIFGVFRHERNGFVDDHARRQMRLIAPHIRRSVLIGRMFEFKAAEVATFVDTLDGLGCGHVSRRCERASDSRQCSRQCHSWRKRYPEFARAGGWSPAMRRSTAPCGTSLWPRDRATPPLAARGSPYR